MNTMDRKIAERRHEVTEERAQGRLRWLLWVVLAVAAVAAVVGVLTSPLFSIRAITVTGAERTDPTAIARAVGVTTGIPTISTRTGPVERALLDEPWIAEADVTVSWPGSIEIHVRERVPIVIVENTDGAYLADADGVLVAAAEPGAMQAFIEATDTGARRPGEQITDRETLAAIDFVAALSPALRRSAHVAVVDGTLQAEVGGYHVALGRPQEMELKAAALDAVIGSGTEIGSRIDVTAPTRPAVASPQSQLDVELETSQDTQPSD